MKKCVILVVFAVISSLLLHGKIIPLPGIQKAETVIIDQNQLLITEFPHVYIYSLKDFKLVKKIGKSGEGPAEFSTVVRVQPDPGQPDKIVVNSRMKVSYFTRKGDFIKEIRSKSNANTNNYKPMGNDIFAAYGFRQDKQRVLYVTVSFFDAHLKKIKEVFAWKGVMQFGQARVNPTDSDLAGGEFKIFDKKLFVLIREEGTVKIFDINGKLLQTIDYNYKRRDITQQDRDRFLEFYKNSKKYRAVYQRFGQQFKFPSKFPATRELSVNDDKIYVLTNIEKDGKSEFIIFDLKGKFLKQALVPYVFENPRDPYPYAIHNGSIYQLVDNEDTEEWELHINEIK